MPPCVVFAYRDTGQIGSVHAQRLCSENGSQWILLGAIDLYSSELRQAGLSARAVERLTGEIVWAELPIWRRGCDSQPPAAPSRRFRSPHHGRRFTACLSPFSKLGSRTAFLLMQSLRRALGFGRLLIIPWDNISGALLADQVVNHVALSVLFQHGFDVIEPAWSTSRRGLSVSCPRARSIWRL